MSKRGKSISVYLMDGDARGRIKCTLANWRGIAYKIPRTDLDKCKDRNHLKQTGVYLLFGTSEEKEKGLVYIGQAGERQNGKGILDRLYEHKRNPEKDYWTEAIVFTTSDDSFGQTEISYLEHRFCSLAKEANRYEVMNKNDPNPGNFTEEKESEMEEFIDYATVIVGTLGHKVFDPVGSKPITNYQTELESIDEEPLLYLEHTFRNKNGGETIKATGRQTADGFVVFKDSNISKYENERITPKIKELRRVALIEDGVLQEDRLFSSPTYAAMFVIGNNANGPKEWKTIDGKSLNDIEMEET